MKRIVAAIAIVVLLGAGATAYALRQHGGSVQKANVVGCTTKEVKLPSFVANQPYDATHLPQTIKIASTSGVTAGTYARAHRAANTGKNTVKVSGKVKGMQLYVDKGGGCKDLFVSVPPQHGYGLVVYTRQG